MKLVFSKVGYILIFKSYNFEYCELEVICNLLFQVSLRATIKAGREVPSLIADITKATIQISSIPASIPACAVSDAVNELEDEARRFIKAVRKCVKKKIENRPDLVEVQYYY